MKLRTAYHRTWLALLVTLVPISFYSFVVRGDFNVDWHDRFLTWVVLLSLIHAIRHEYRSLRKILEEVCRMS